MAEPAFSVVIAAFNSEERIGATIASVLGQSRTDLELIVVDDGSTDETAGVVERFTAADGRVRLLRQANQGTVAARNAGVQEAGGRFVSFLDDDDLWLPGYLAAIAAGFDRAPGAGLAYTDAAVTTGTGEDGYSALDRFARRTRRLPAALGGEAALRALLHVNFITTCAATASREALDAVGQLDPAIRGCDDWDLWVRIAAAGFGLVGVRERLVARRMRTDSVGSDERMMAAGSRAVLAKFLASGAGDPRAKRVARRHLWLIDRELTAMDGGRPLSRSAWGALRRLGRKRIRLRRPGSLPQSS